MTSCALGAPPWCPAHLKTTMLPNARPSRTRLHVTKHRLKLIQPSGQFLFLQRGLPKILVLDRQMRAVAWGTLQLVFRCELPLFAWHACL